MLLSNFAQSLSKIARRLVEPHCKGTCQMNRYMKTLRSLLRFPLVYGLFLTVPAIFPSPSLATLVEGVVVVEQGPLDGAVVSAYGSLEDIRGDKPLYRSLPGDKPGFYRLDIPPGAYHLVATGNHAGVEYFSFHGANPVTIANEKLWLPFVATPKTTAALQKSEVPRLAGIVTYKGKPVADALVSLYPASGRQYKGLGIVTQTTGADGRFAIDAVEGDYTVVARKRMASDGVMQLRKGDLFCYYADNPVAVADGTETTVEIPCYPKDDVKGFLAEGAAVKRTRGELARFRERSAEEPGAYGISGRIADVEGKPAPGLVVMAFKGEPGQLFRMNIPRLKSEFIGRTDAAGAFSIAVKDPGTYYLMAREFSGTSPHRGELFGLYEGNVDHAVTVAGQLKDVAITVGRVMAPRANREASGRAAPPMGPGRRRALLRLGDTVIDRDTVWGGTVEIAGRVVVARRATLTIRPGTVVKFRKIDRDQDGVGDGELRVLGRLVAEGTPRQRIRFISAEKKPRRGDWSYILVFTSGAENVLRYCEVKHAFTGFQAHFSRAVVSDSVFTDNDEGVRFGRAEMIIAHNDIEHNRYGIRYHRLEGPVSIEYNVIRNNDVGLFFVPSGQNRVDFMPDEYEADPAYAMMPLIRFNDISGNRRYDYRFGDRQRYDVVARDNWWGTKNLLKIYSRIYDKRSDADLGEVSLLPVLSAPPKGAGVRRGAVR